MGGYMNDYRRDQYNYLFEPDSPFSGYSLPKKSLYSNSLTELSQRTDANLNRLREALVSRDPCYDYGIEHWHPDHRKPPGKLSLSFGHVLLSGSFGLSTKEPYTIINCPSASLASVCAHLPLAQG